MRISSFNINKFCGAYSSLNGGYYNPKNIDFKADIKKIVDLLLNDKNDIIFLQEFTDNRFIKAEDELFKKDKYRVFYNSSKLKKSHVVAITLAGSSWKRIVPDDGDEFINKFIEMELSEEKEEKLSVISLHNTDKNIKTKMNNYFNKRDKQIILGDFNDIEWIDELNNKKNGYRDLVTNDMVTYKPAQTAIDRIFVKEGVYDNKIVFNGILETYTSDHNVLTFLLNI